jgi:hypothetical protein
LPPDPEAAAREARPPPGRQRDGGAETVAARFAVEADCCSALSCRETDGLLKVETDEGQRVLCPDHAPGWVRR